jgi:hypothetical protein
MTNLAANLAATARDHRDRPAIKLDDLPAVPLAGRGAAKGTDGQDPAPRGRAAAIVVSALRRRRPAWRQDG